VRKAALLRGLLIRWSQVRIPHGLPRIIKEAHEFTFVGFFVSGRSLVASKTVRSLPVRINIEKPSQKASLNLRYHAEKDLLRQA